MTAPRLQRARRPNMRRVVLLFPSGFTLGNLFFGVYAIITAARGDFHMAGIWVLWGGICDALDGRVARATNAGSQFGEELDSLVDAISFGLAPAMIMYFAVLNREGWDWIWVFAFAACAVMCLARFNIEQAGTAKTYFQGLPSPAAGCTLASYYWFSQSPFYQYAAIGNLPWQTMLRFLMIALACLMISNVPYPVFPRTGFKSLRALFGSSLMILTFVLLWTKHLEFFFPLTLIYVASGLVRWGFAGLFERRQPTIPYDLSEGEDDEEEIFEIGSSQVHTSRQGHRDSRPAVREERHRRHREPTAEKPAVAAPAAAETAERGPRPQRTEAERAERKERREKRDQKQKKRQDRQKRTDETAVALGTAAAESLPEPIVEDLPGGADVPAAGGEATVDDAAPRARKRKRRRRRGERRPGAPGGADGEGAAEGDSDSDGAAGPYADEAPPSHSEPPE